jgi:outer membrane receptor protein involved in Fe transport
MGDMQVMNYRRTLIARAVHSAVIAGTLTAGAGLTATAAVAQDEDSLEEIVVTGSRLRRDRDFVEVSPIATIDSAQIQDSGYLTLEQTVNRMPQLRPDTTSSTNQYGGAAMSADVRGLGAVRTLVLVDGRRFIPAEDTGIADLATIPDILIQSVEIVTGGASAVYGSDAIAGAVNFRLRDDFQGLEFRYQRGETSEGDGETERFDLMLGAGTDDGNDLGRRAGILPHTVRDKFKRRVRTVWIWQHTGHRDCAATGAVPADQRRRPEQFGRLLPGPDPGGALRRRQPSRAILPAYRPVQLRRRQLPAEAYGTLPDQHHRQARDQRSGRGVCPGLLQQL